MTVDENYVRESILDPQAQVTAGFDPVMPTYRGRLKDEEISAILGADKSVESVVWDLIEAANSAGGLDNTTVAVIDAR